MSRALDCRSAVASSWWVAAIAAALVWVGVGGCAATRPDRAPTSLTSIPDTALLQRESPFIVRPFDPTLEGRWIGNAISYGPYRDGQAPGQAEPTDAQIREDLQIMARRWNLLRVYGSTGPTERMLAIIREERLPIRVMLGAWVGVEERRDSLGTVTERYPAAVQGNREQTEAAVRLANEYPGLIVAISVGNETQVSWSPHRMPAAQLIGYVHSIRARTRVPVTTADDYNFWNKPQSNAVAAELDFIVMHAHPLWNGKSLEEALPWTVEQVMAIEAAHPLRQVVVGETGWATRRHHEGEQGRLIKGSAGEAEQKVFCDAAAAWARESGTVLFLFEAFDENWKGGSHPDEVEKHWGLYRADRTPKPVVTPER